VFADDDDEHYYFTSTVGSKPEHDEQAGKQAGRQAGKQVWWSCAVQRRFAAYPINNKMGPSLTCPLSDMHASSQTIIIILIIIITIRRPSEKKSWQ